MYFSGQGKLFYAARDDNGNPGAFIFAGNVPELKISLSTETTEHTESTSGQRLTDFRLTKSKKAEISFSLEDWSLQNLAVGMYGSVLPPSAPTAVTAENLGTVKAGDYIALKGQNVADLVISDSTASTPLTLEAGVDYILNDAFGSVQIISDMSGFVMPLSAAYTPSASLGSVTMFSTLPPERWFRFEGLNSAAQNKPVLVEMYRTILDPMKELDLINTDLMKLDLAGSALYDSARGADANFGNFGRVVFVG